jgi:hypothetical protein
MSSAYLVSKENASPSRSVKLPFNDLSCVDRRMVI